MVVAAGIHAAEEGATPTTDLQPGVGEKTLPASEQGGVLKSAAMSKAHREGGKPGLSSWGACTRLAFSLGQQNMS